MLIIYIYSLMPWKKAYEIDWKILGVGMNDICLDPLNLDLEHIPLLTRHSKVTLE